MIDLDKAATTAVRPEVLQAMWPYLTTEYGNPASVHQLGSRAADAVRWARETIADAFGLSPSGVVFTSGGTEADNLAVKGIALASPRGKHVIASAIEHPAVLESCGFLERVCGFAVSRLGVDAAGEILLDELAGLARPDTTLISVMAANNEIGTIEPIAEVTALARELGIPVHVDAVQAIGSIPISLTGLGASAVTISGHKIGGPKGVGALLLAPGVRVEPVIHGGGQQRGRRSGTENVAGIVGLAVAVQLMAAPLPDGALVADTQAFISSVLARVPGAVLTGHRTRRLPGHASFCLTGVSGESVLLELDRSGVVVSSGSACAAGRSDPSPVLLACGVPAEVAQSAVRVTFGSEARAELPGVVDLLADVVARVGLLGA